MGDGISSEKWKEDSWHQRSIDFAWTFRFLFTGAPWAAITTFFNMFNLLVNVFLNKLWGGMNVILLWNSFVSLTQGFASFLLISQVPTYMAHMKTMRMFSFTLAVMYNVFWLWAVVEFIVGKNKADAVHVDYSFMMLLIDVFWMYNFLSNLPIAITNFIIIVCELDFTYGGP